MFLNSFNYFRAIAIIYIVSAHTYWVAHWKKTQLWERLINIMVADGTVLFVFISGFLFYHVFYPRYKYSDFVRKKFKNVFVPYLILSTIPILYYLYIQSGPVDYFFFNYKKPPGIWNQYIEPALLYYAFGGAQPPYWYMPFIMLTFLISPVHVKFIEMNTVAQSVILFLLLIISMLLHRPVNNLNPLQAVGYFSSAYFLGIFCSIHKEKIYQLLKGKEFYLLIPIIGLIVFQAWKLPTIHLYVKPAFELSYPDIIFLQKVFLCVFFMVFLHRFESIYLKSLDTIAKASFAIFFLHCFVIKFIEMIIEIAGINYKGNALVWVMMTGLIIYFSYLLALFIKKVFPIKNSRILIGW